MAAMSGIFYFFIFGEQVKIPGMLLACHANTAEKSAVVKNYGMPVVR